MHCITSYGEKEAQIVIMGRLMSNEIWAYVKFTPKYAKRIYECVIRPSAQGDIKLNVNYMVNATKFTQRINQKYLEKGMFYVFVKNIDPATIQRVIAKT